MFDTPQVYKLINLAIEEDLGFGDVTTELTVAEDHRRLAEAVARQRCVICGLSIVEKIFDVLRWECTVQFHVNDGDEVDEDTILFTLEGKTRYILSSERIILNFLQRLSGIATYTRDFVKNSSGITVLDTRKTTPGWRVLEKYAVKVGGARNHRSHLGDMILIKDNHLDANTIAPEDLIKNVKSKKPFYMPIEVEVRTVDELINVLDGGPDIIMLDNMSNGEIKKALEIIKSRDPKMRVEVSGGITAERIESLKSFDLCAVSIGSLTGKAPVVDISIRLKKDDLHDGQR